MVILVTTFLMYAGFFMVIPLLSVHYVSGLDWAAGAIGLVLAVRQFVQQGLAFVGGVMADRLGAKAPLVAGMLLRGIGFVGMAWADSLTLLFLTSILAALGGSLFEAPRSAAIAALTEEHDRARFYSLAGVIGGVGLTVGPLLGVLLLRVDFAVVALVSGGIFLLTAALAAALMPPVRVATGSSTRLTQGLGLALHDRRFIVFTVLAMGYWFMWVQLAISLPLKATAIAGTSDAVGWIYVLNAVLTILLQYPLLRLAERWLEPLLIMTAGMALMAVGLATVGTSSSVPVLMIAVAIFSIGGLLGQPSMQAVTAKLANPAALGAYFGVGMYALAIGGSLGNFLGGYLYGLGDRLDAPAMPWLIFGTVGALATVGLWRMHGAQDAMQSAGARNVVNDEKVVTP
jgi:DHA1 family multidrug resistance protein-like MFS transporter